MPSRLVASAGRPDILVDRLMVVVGRHPHCDAQLPSSRVSRWHCCLTEVDGELWVRDLGSTNGIWINGRRVISGRVRSGDVLAIAHIHYRLEEGQADPLCPAEFPSRPECGGIAPADSPGRSLEERIEARGTRQESWEDQGFG
jgi:predicted component of type VI protein secretion system